MQPRASEVFQPMTPKGEVWSPNYEPDPDKFIEPEANLAGTMAVGLIFVFIGFAVLMELSTVIGAGLLIFGFLVWIAAYVADKYHDSMSPLADEAQWAEFEQDLASSDEAFSEKELTQRQIDEIVKAVKTTIKVRCRYCGTLNEEAASKCESCGANM